MSTQETMSEWGADAGRAVVASDGPQTVETDLADATEPTAHPAGSLRRRGLIALGVGVVALSGLAAAAALTGTDPTEVAGGFPISTCCPGEPN